VDIAWRFNASTPMTHQRIANHSAPLMAVCFHLLATNSWLSSCRGQSCRSDFDPLDDVGRSQLRADKLPRWITPPAARVRAPHSEGLQKRMILHLKKPARSKCK